MANTKDKDIEALRKHVVMPEPSSALREKILMDAENTLKPGFTRILWPFGPAWKPAGVLTTAMALGILVGFAALPMVDSQDISDEIDIMILG